MPLSIEFNHPHFPKGTEFDLGGILVVNGETTEVEEDDELRFVSRNRQAVRDKLQGHEFAKVSGDSHFGPAKVAEMYPEPEAPVAVVEEVPATPENPPVAESEDDQ